MPYADTPDLRLYYDIRGRGPRLLFIWGTGGDLRQVPNAFTTPLADDFTVLAYDQRGLGRSDKPDRAYGMADYGDDAAALLDAVGWDRCAVIGVSFGGMVAQEVALRHPDRVTRLAICCAAAGGAGGASYPLHELADLAPEDQAREMVLLGDTRRDDAWRDANKPLYDSLIADRVAKLRFAAAQPGGERGARRQLEARRGHDTFARIGRLAMPARVFGGRYDGIAAPEAVAAMAARLPGGADGAHLWMFEGGHLFFQDDPAAFPAIAQFLSGADDA